MEKTIDKKPADIKVGTPSPGFKVIGTRPVRHDGVEKVTGRAVYGADVKMQGLLFGKMLRSPHAHARIISIDTSAALALPGVKSVVTGRDLPDHGDEMVDLGEGVVNLRWVRGNALAIDKVLYHGHAVAAVAATSIHIAEEALALIHVEYEVLPPVMDLRTAMADGAPLLHEKLFTDEMGARSATPSNIASHNQQSAGDVEKAFKDAHLVVEREFYTGTVHQGYIEPQNATALWHEDDQITVWCSTQGAFPVRAQTAGIVHVPVSKVRVVPTEIGGGFGGKLGVYLEPVAAMLSKKSGHRPVRMTMSRDEVLKATGPTSGSHITVKMAVDAHGRLVAGKTMLAYEAGAYPGSPVGAAMGVIFSPYRLPNVLIDGYDVVVNKPKAAAYRAPGGTNAAYAAEVVIDELAGLLKMDPLEFRRLNAVREGDRRADGPVFQKIGCVETLEAIMFSNHYHSELPKPSSPTGKVGRGVASGFWFNWGGKSSATAAVNPNGTVSLVEGSTDIGGSRTSFAMQLAEALGITAEEVIPTVVDTNSVGYNDATGGSRTTFASGLVAFELARKIKAELCQRAALHWEVKAEDVKVDGAMYSCGDMKIEFHDLVKKLDETGGPINVAATGESTQYGGAFGTHVVDVEVDTDTGKTQILRYTAAQDVGRAIHPSYVEGQIQGGAAQGVGWALNEEYVYDKDGHLLNANFLDYRMPTALDLPMIDVLIVEVPNPAHPFGVRGVGEVPIVPPAGAVANAIANATGVRMTVLPMSPRRVLEAMGKI